MDALYFLLNVYLFKSYSTLSLSLSIVQVLLHDPLYIWTISHKKARHIQSSTAVEWAGETSAATDVSSNNKMAERVLIRCCLLL